MDCTTQSKGGCVIALPGEREHVQYLQYLERFDLGEEEGERLSKDEWRKLRKKQETQKPPEQPGRMSRMLSGTDG